MIENVTYKDDSGDIEIDISGEELLKRRADVDKGESEKTSGEFDIRGFEGDKAGLGDEESYEANKRERKLKTDLKRTNWHEARKATDVKHVCPVCGTRYWGRPNKRYCCDPCKEVAKKRRYRKNKRDIRDFKPHRGTGGEIYYKTENQVITFVPAFNADTRVRAKKYLEDTYSKEEAEKYYNQIKEVVRK